GLGIFIWTPTAMKFARSQSFWPLLMTGFGLGALVSVVLGFRNGEIEPMIRGDSTHYCRDTQPMRFWASVAWNGFMGCLFILLAFKMATPAESQPVSDDANRCFDIHTASPQEELAACNKLLLNRGELSASALAPLYVGRSFAYDR